jgi:hypothetical protein
MPDSLYSGNCLRKGWASTPTQWQLVRLMFRGRNRDGTIQAVVSHDSALEAYELSAVLPGKVHLTVPRSFRKQPRPATLPPNPLHPVTPRVSPVV